MNAPSDRETLEALLATPAEIQAIVLSALERTDFGYYRTDTRCPVDAYRQGTPPGEYQVLNLHRRFRIGEDPVGTAEQPTLLWSGDRVVFEAVLQASP